MASQVAAIKAIKASIQSQSYDAALTAAAKALAEAPNNVDLLTLAAFAATRKGDLPSAQRFISEAFKLAPNDGEVRKGLLEVHRRSGNYAGQLEVLTLMRGDVRTATATVDIDARIAGAHFALGDAPRAATTLAGALADIARILAAPSDVSDPSPATADVATGATKLTGASASAAAAPVDVVRLKEQRLRLAKALVDTREAIIIGSGSITNIAAAEEYKARLLAHGHTLTDAQMQWNTWRDEAAPPGPPDTATCAQLVRQVQLAADRAKCALVAAPVAAAVPAPAPASSSLPSSAASAGAASVTTGSAFGAYCTAVEDVRRVAVYALRRLLPSWTPSGSGGGTPSQANPSPSLSPGVAASSLGWSTQPPHVRAAVVAVCELALAYGWPLLSGRLVSSLLTALAAVSAASASVAPPSVVGRLAAAVRAVVAATPVPPLSDALKRSTAALHGPHQAAVSAVLDEAVAAESSLSDRVRLGIPWVSACLAGVYGATAVLTPNHADKLSAAQIAAEKLASAISSIGTANGMISLAASAFPGSWQPNAVDAVPSADLAIGSVRSSLAPTAVVALAITAQSSSTADASISTMKPATTASSQALPVSPAPQPLAAPGSLVLALLSSQLAHSYRFLGRSGDATKVIDSLLHATPHHSDLTPDVNLPWACFAAFTRAQLQLVAAHASLDALEVEHALLHPDPMQLIAAQPTDTRIIAARKRLDGSVAASTRFQDTASRLSGLGTALQTSSTGLSLSAGQSTAEGRIRFLTGDVEEAVSLLQAATQQAKEARSPAIAGAAAAASLAEMGADAPMESIGSSSVTVLLRSLHDCVDNHGGRGGVSLLHACGSVSCVDDVSLAAANVWLGRACWFSSQPANRIEGAKNALVSAGIRDPVSPSAFAWLGVWLAAGDATIPHVRRWSPSLVQAPTPTAATSSSQSRDLASARASFDKALSFRPDEPVACLCASDLAVASSQAEAAADMLQSALAFSPRAAWARWRLGGILSTVALRSLAAAAAYRTQAESAESDALVAALSRRGASRGDTLGGSGSETDDVISNNGLEGLLQPSRLGKLSGLDNGMGTSKAAVSDDAASASIETFYRQSRAESTGAEEAFAFAAAEYNKALALLPHPLSSSTAVHLTMVEAGDTTASSSATEAAKVVAGELSVVACIPMACGCWHGLSVVYQAQGKNVAALKAAEEAIRTRFLGSPDPAVVALADPGRPLDAATMRGAPPVTLCLLAECHIALGSYDDAVAALEAATADKERCNMAAWTSLAAAHRSLARRCVGDGLAAEGMRHVRAGLLAAHAALQQLPQQQPQHATGPGAGTVRAEAAADPTPTRDPVSIYDFIRPPTSLGVLSTAPTLTSADPSNDGQTFTTQAAPPEQSYPVYKLLGDLHGVAYDAVPALFGPVAAAASLDQLDCLQNLPSKPSSVPDASASVSAWIASETLSVADVQVSVRADSLSSSVGPRTTALAAYLPLIVSSARSGAMAYARGVDALLKRSDATSRPRQTSNVPADEDPIYSQTPAVIASQVDTNSAITAADVSEASSRASARAVCSAFCDLGRCLGLHALAIAYACGSTGLVEPEPESSAEDDLIPSKGAMRPRRHGVTNFSPAMLAALRYAARLRRAAAVAHARALAVCPGSARAWNGLGCTAAHPLRQQHALVRSVELGGGGIALVNLGALYAQHGRLDLAAEVLLQAQSKDPNNEAMWLTHGLIHDASLALHEAGVDAMSLPNTPVPSAASLLQQAGAAYMLATDLSLHPASLLPAASHLLAVAAIAPGADTSQWGVTSPALSPDADAGNVASVSATSGGSKGTDDAEIFARLALDKDFTNPLAAFVLVQARLLQAAGASYAAEAVLGYARLSPAAAAGAHRYTWCGADPIGLAALALPYRRGADGAEDCAPSPVGVGGRTVARSLAERWQRVASLCAIALQSLKAFVGLSSSTTDPDSSEGFIVAVRALRSYAHAMSAVYEPHSDKSLQAWHSAAKTSAECILGKDGIGTIDDALSAQVKTLSKAVSATAGSGSQSNAPAFTTAIAVHSLAVAMLGSLPRSAELLLAALQSIEESAPAEDDISILPARLVYAVLLSRVTGAVASPTGSPGAPLPDGTLTAAKAALELLKRASRKDPQSSGLWHATMELAGAAGNVGARSAASLRLFILDGGDDQDPAMPWQSASRCLSLSSAIASAWAEAGSARRIDIAALQAFIATGGSCLAWVRVAQAICASTNKTGLAAAVKAGRSRLAAWVQATKFGVRVRVAQNVTNSGFVVEGSVQLAEEDATVLQHTYGLQLVEAELARLHSVAVEAQSTQAATKGLASLSLMHDHPWHRNFS